MNTASFQKLACALVRSRSGQSCHRKIPKPKSAPHSQPRSLPPGTRVGLKTRTSTSYRGPHVSPLPSINIIATLRDNEIPRSGLRARTGQWSSRLRSLWRRQLRCCGCASTPAGLRATSTGPVQGSRTACSRLGIAYYEGKDEAGGPIPLDHRQASSGSGGRLPAWARRELLLWARCVCAVRADLSMGSAALICGDGPGELGDGLSCRKTAEGYVDGSVG